MDGIVDFMEQQVNNSREREQSWFNEYHASNSQNFQVLNQLETTRHQAQEWINREGQVAQGVVQSFQSELSVGRLRIEMMEQEANMIHTHVR
eukprot:3279377-Amphidinium_carterae.3